MWSRRRDSQGWVGPRCQAVGKLPTAEWRVPTADCGVLITDWRVVADWRAMADCCCTAETRTVFDTPQSTLDPQSTIVTRQPAVDNRRSAIGNRPPATAFSGATETAPSARSRSASSSAPMWRRRRGRAGPSRRARSTVRSCRSTPLPRTGARRSHPPGR
jgi:hypothetical protein